RASAVAAATVANRRFQPEQPIDAVGPQGLVYRLPPLGEALFAGGGGACFQGTERLKEIEELLYGLQILAASIRVAELQGGAKCTREGGVGPGRTKTPRVTGWV